MSIRLGIAIFLLFLALAGCGKRMTSANRVSSAAPIFDAPAPLPSILPLPSPSPVPVAVARIKFFPNQYLLQRGIPLEVLRTVGLGEFDGYADIQGGVSIFECAPVAGSPRPSAILTYSPSADCGANKGLDNGKKLFMLAPAASSENAHHFRLCFSPGALSYFTKIGGNLCHELQGLFPDAIELPVAGRGYAGASGYTLR